MGRIIRPTIHFILSSPLRLSFPLSLFAPAALHSFIPSLIMGLVSSLFFLVPKLMMSAWKNCGLVSFLSPTKQRIGERKEAHISFSKAYHQQEQEINWKRKGIFYLGFYGGLLFYFGDMAGFIFKDK